MKQLTCNEFYMRYTSSYVYLTNSSSHSSVPVYFIWLKYISWFNYANEALCVNQWKDVEKIKCETYTNTTVLCLNDGMEVLEDLSYDPVSIVKSKWMLSSAFFTFAEFAYIRINGAAEESLNSQLK